MPTAGLNVVAKRKIGRITLNWILRHFPMDVTYSVKQNKLV
jgi:hypothetical protein